MYQTEETMASTAKQSTFKVSEPFDSDPSADVVLRSSDNFEFRARKAILSLASPIFDEMFGKPQRESTGENMRSKLHEASLPCILLTESGVVVDILLRYCYPVPRPLIMDNSETVFAVRSASDKYVLTFIRASIDEDMKKLHTNDPRYSVFCYRSACDHRMATQTRQLAWDCLRFPLSTIVKHWEPGPSTDKALSNLVDYHYTVSIRIGEYISNIIDIKQRAMYTIWRCCSSCYISIDGKGTQPKWWLTNLTSELQRIYKERPISGRILNLPPSLPEPVLTYLKGLGDASVRTALPSERFPNSDKETLDLGAKLPPEQILSELCQTCQISALKNWAVFITELNEGIEDEAKKINFVLPWGPSEDGIVF